MHLARLVISGFSQRRARTALTVLAVALSVSLVVAVTSGYSSAEAVVYRYFAEAMGATDLEVSRQDNPAGYVDQSLVDEIRRDRDVQRVAGRLYTGGKLLDGSGKPVIGAASWMNAEITGVVLPDDEETALLRMEPGTPGAWFAGARGDVAVIDQEAARLLKASVGDEFVLPAPDRQLRLKVVGIVHKPTMMAALLVQTVYVPVETLQELIGARGKVSRIVINLKTGVDADAFHERWKARLAKLDPGLSITQVRESRKEMDKQLQGARFMSYMGGAVAMLAAACIIFSTLSMGVSERQRTLGMLRAIGAAKVQVAFVVVVEGVLLAGAGAGLGVPMGLGWVHALVRWKSQFFSEGVVASWGGVAFAAGAAVLTALAASILPAWNATRVSPLEAMAPQGQPRRSRVPWKLVGVGLVLIFVDSFMIFSPAVPRWATFYGHFALGLPCLMLGFFLVAPLGVWLVEMTLGRVVAGVMGVRHALLAQQLTGSIWRSAGTASALMVGLAILVVLQVQGNTVLGGWRLPTRFPDIFIASTMGLTRDQVRKLEGVEGIQPGEVLPIGVAVARLQTGFFSLIGAALMPDATMFLSVDPDRALAMMELEFREGTAAGAAKLLKQGRHVIVTEEFRQLKGLGLGDTIKLKTPRSGEVDYTIAGVVWSPGIDVFVSRFQMNRQFTQRSAASVFGSTDDGERDFGIEKYHLVAANLKYFVSKKQVEDQVWNQLSIQGLQTGDVREIKAGIQNGFRKLLFVISSLAFASIAVAALGVANTVMASVRSRQWQLGVLRSIGVTRLQMLRLILAEALLLGFVGSALGLAAGLLMGVNANGLNRKIVGYSPPLVIPRDVLGWGVVIILVVAILASLWPAIVAAREEPLELLQAGRSGG